MTRNITWKEISEMYRQLGGVADNVCINDGAIRRGVFPIDPLKPVMIHAPENLLFPVVDIEFENGALRIKKSASSVGTREREFFDIYQESFSWGAGGREDCAAFIMAMEALPAEVREILEKDIGLQALFQGTIEERTQNRFLKSRMIRSRGRQVIMPIIDLINHGIQGVEFKYKDGITVTGTFEDEVLTRYNLNDPLGVLSVWSFASPEPRAFSLPMRLPLDSGHLIIHRNLREKSKLENIPTPAFTTDGDDIVLSHLLLGDVKYPKLPKSIFYRFMKDQGREQSAAEELFDRIQHFNRTRFLKLMIAVDGLEGQAAALLRKTAQYQLQALSCYLGARKL